MKKLLQDGTRLTDSKDLAEVKRAVPKLQRALELDPKAGWAYLILGSAHAKLGDPAAGTRAYETYLLSCRTYPNADRVQRILSDYWRATGGKDDPSPPTLRGTSRPPGCSGVAASPCDAGSRISRMRALLMRLTRLLDPAPRGDRVQQDARHPATPLRTALLPDRAGVRPAHDRRWAWAESTWPAPTSTAASRTAGSPQSTSRWSGTRTTAACPRRACPSPRSPDGGSDQGRPVQFTNLGTDGGSIVMTDSFAGMATVDDARNRLFLPTRSAARKTSWW